MAIGGRRRYTLTPEKSGYTARRVGVAGAQNKNHTQIPKGTGYIRDKGLNENRHAYRDIPRLQRKRP
jgi:hypothetical protein